MFTDPLAIDTSTLPEPIIPDEEDEGKEEGKEEKKGVLGGLFSK